jgi:hypothetical protein
MLLLNRQFARTRKPSSLRGQEAPLNRSQLALTLLAWGGVGLFWFYATRSFHPTFSLAVIVTTSLDVAFACASYVNHLALVPIFWRTRRQFAYAALLLLVMAVFTGIALVIIRLSYFAQVGPNYSGAGLNGFYVHFAIDFFGMTVHVAAAAIVVWVWRKVRPRLR